MKNHPFSVIISCSIMKKKPISPFQVAPSPSLSTIRDIREIRSLSIKVPSSLSNNQSPPPPRVYRFYMCSPFVQLVKFVVFYVHSPPPCQTISPLPFLRLHRLPLRPPFVTFEKFVVFQIHSPPPCQIISPLHSLRLHRLHLCPPFVTFEKFVVFQLKSPPPCQTISPLHPLECIVSICVHHSCN